MNICHKLVSSVVQLRTLVLVFVAGLTIGCPFATASERQTVNYHKQIIGPTALVKEAESKFTFPARVDTGATTSSLHVEAWRIENEAPQMADNIGKTIRFRIKNHRGESEWLKRKIAEISVIKTSEQEEVRYKVPMTLNCQDVKKRVLVSLNDRSHMTYPLLLGRNFLEHHFVVDVALGNEEAQDEIVEPTSVTVAQADTAS